MISSTAWETQPLMLELITGHTLVVDVATTSFLHHFLLKLTVQNSIFHTM